MKHSLDLTKKVCMCTFISILLITLFVLSPLSNLFKTSLFMKLLALIIVGYSIYLSIQQTNLLKFVDQSNNQNPQLNSQVNMNIICSYVFTTFLVLFFIFILKNLFFM